MPKRFTDTEKWKDEWYLSLDNDMRIVWQYLLDSCSIGGVLKKNFKLLNFCCNTDLTPDKFMKVFRKRVVDCDNFYFIPKFLKFQYPKGLNSDKPAVVSVRNEVIYLGLSDLIRKSLGNDYLIIKDKDKDKDKGLTPHRNGVLPIGQKQCMDCERIFPSEAMFRSHLKVCRESV